MAGLITFSYAIIGESSTSSGWGIGDHIIDTDPLLVDCDSGDLRLWEGSPALGTGKPGYGVNKGAYQGTGVARPHLQLSAPIDFGSVELGGASVHRRYEVSGAHLWGPVVATPPAQWFEISLDSGDASVPQDSIVLMPVDSTVALTPIYVRFIPGRLGPVTAAIDHQSPKASPVALNVTGTGFDINDGPAIVAQLPVMVPEDSSIVIALDMLTVDDPDNAYPADFSLELGAATGTYTLAGDTLKPDPDFYGVITVPLRVFDGELWSDWFDLQVQVTGVNDAPVFSSLPDSLVFCDSESETLMVAAYVTDVDSGDTAFAWHFAIDNDSVSWTFDTLAGRLVLEAPGFDGYAILRIRAADAGDSAVDSIVVRVIGDATGVRPHALPLQYVCGVNTPNPVRNTTLIPYALPEPGHVSIRLYDINGELMRVIADGYRGAGWHAQVIRPDGLACGAYVCRVEVGPIRRLLRVTVAR
ncbi:MAG: hypothetical protein GF331_12875 [Chitinivibrionales bacterium]|nr:hypothetical protein [Chitinivibrionales bacterium]